jgi:hypothetical protein
VENDGSLLFEQIVKMDLEGMVCKRKDSPYRVTEKPSPYWIKVKNRRYSQAGDLNCTLFELIWFSWCDSSSSVTFWKASCLGQRGQT